MEFRQLRYFKMVADSASFARGAEKLRVAQPALSRSIAKLEDEIGCRLLVRHSSGVSMTDAGRRFYDHADEVLKSLRHLNEGMALQDGIPRGTVKIGAPQSIQLKLLAPVVAEFLRAYPACRIDLIQNSGARLRDQVADGSLDLALVPSGAEAGLHHVPLIKESICLICREEDRSHFADQLELHELLGLPLVITGHPDSLRLMIDRRFPHRSDELDIRSEVNSATTLVSLVRRQVGYGIAPSCVASEEAGADLKAVPIAELYASWSIVSRWDGRGLLAIQELEKAIQAHVVDLVSSSCWPNASQEP